MPTYNTMGKTCFILLFTAILLTAPSCSVLTKSQVAAVKELSIVSDTISTSPALMFKALGRVRTGRGILYAGSISTPDIHLREISEVAGNSLSDDRTAEKMLAYTTALNSYIRALGSMANTARYSSLGVEFRGIGRNIDSMLIYSNQATGWETPVGFAKVTGRYLGLAAETFMRYRQARIVRDYVTECDTLVSLCIDEMVGILKSGQVEEIFDNEEMELDRNYLVFLQSRAVASFPPDVAADELYVRLRGNLDDATVIRRRCISGLQAFKRAHHKLVGMLAEKAKMEHMLTELVVLEKINVQLSYLINKYY